MRTIERFSNGQRVQVEATDPNDPLHGKTGTVVRLRRADDGAWVRMDEDLPPEERRFDDERARDLLLYPDVCVEVAS